MKNKIISLFFLFIIAGGLNSCYKDEFFELKPYNPPWTTMYNLEQTVASAYSNILTSGWDGGYFMTSRVTHVYQSDIAQYITQAVTDWPSVISYNRQTSVRHSNLDGCFVSAYKGIQICNEGLSFLENNGADKLQQITETDITENIPRIKGELYFMRAYALWLFTTTHLPAYEPGGANDDKLLPLRLSSIDGLGIEDLSAPEIATTKKIYDQMIADFKKAEELLPKEYIAGTHHTSFDERAKKYAAKAMLAKAYFAMGDYTNAITYLDDVIANSGCNLNQDPIEAFVQTEGSHADEVIWDAIGNNINDEEGFKGGSIIGLYHYKGPKDTTSFDPSWTAGDSKYTDYKDKLNICDWRQTSMSYYTLQQIGWMTDPLNGDYSETEEAQKDKRYQQLYKRLEGHISIDPNNPFAKAVNPLKYELDYSTITTPNVWSQKYFRAGQITSVPIIRLPEMYLTRAIIRFKNGDEAGAMADVNAVRKRAGLDDLTTITAQDIHNERIKELGFEGDRLNYIRALKNDATIGIKGADGKIGLPAGDRSEGTIEYTSDKLYWQVPISELELNTNL